MKRKVICIVILMLTLAMSEIKAGNGGGNLPFLFKPTHPENVGNQPSKGPVYIPTVYLDGNVLSFDDALEGCTVQLLDEDGVVVFSHFIGENETSVTFPSTLTGTYELQIVCGSITFYCYIEL